MFKKLKLTKIGIPKIQRIFENDQSNLKSKVALKTVAIFSIYERFSREKSKDIDQR